MKRPCKAYDRLEISLLERPVQSGIVQCQASPRTARNMLAGTRLLLVECCGEERHNVPIFCLDSYLKMLVHCVSRDPL